MAARPEVRVVGATDSAPSRDGVVRVWEDAFGPIDDVSAWGGEVWDRHRSREDYRLAVACAGDDVVGFAWGYTGRRGQFWSDRVVELLPGVADEWVGGHWEFVELAVATTHRGRGVGGALHDALLDGLPHERALLGTSWRPGNPAAALYRSRGWSEIGRMPPDALVMGLRMSDRRRP